jgi:hypothetical protein
VAVQMDERRGHETTIPGESTIIAARLFDQSVNSQSNILGDAS